MLRLQSQWFIHSFISVGVPKKEPSHEKRGKHFHVTVRYGRGVSLMGGFQEVKRPVGGVDHPPSTPM